MMLNLSSDLTFFGPALPEAFVQHELEAALAKALPSAKEVEPAWKALHKSLREPLLNAGAVRIRNVVLNSLIKVLSYSTLDHAETVRTREGDEDGGYLFQ